MQNLARLAAATAVAFAALAPRALADEQEAIVVLQDASASDRAGRAVALEGDLLVVSAIQGGFEGRGQVGFFQRLGSEWFQLQTLDSPGGRSFGAAVALEEDTLAVGATGTDYDEFDNAGVVHIYERSNNAWSLVQTLQAPTPRNSDEFGRALSLDGDHLAVGARQGDLVQSGHVTVFLRTDGVWAVEQSVVPDEHHTYQNFGRSVALSEGSLAVGATPTGPTSEPGGAVRIFTVEEGQWTQQAKIIPAGADTNDSVGCDVDLQGDTVLFGAFLDDHSGEFNAGAAYVYTRSGDTWSEEAMLIADTVQRNSYFGSYVALQDDVAVVTAPRMDIEPDFQVGEVSVFEREASVWTYSHLLSNPDLSLGTNFGESVAISDTDIVVGWLGYESETGANVVFQPDEEAPPTAFIAPKKVTLSLPTGVTKKSPPPSLSASGILDTGVDTVDLSLPGTLSLGSHEIAFSEGLTPTTSQGKKYAGEAGGASLKLTLDKKGSSETRFTLRYSGDLTGDAVTDGPLKIGYATDEFDAQSTVVMTHGSFKRGKLPASVVAPSLDVRKANLALRGPSRDNLQLTLGFASDGTAPLAPSDFEIGFGAYLGVVPAASLAVKSGEKFQFKGDIDGIKKVTINYAKGEIQIKLRKTTLGLYGEGGAPALVEVTLDGETQTLAFRIGGTGPKKRNY